MTGIEETVISAGIDVGTSTTQVIFSQIRLKNTGGFGCIPKIEIIDKTIFYRSRIHFTPLIREDEIDEKKVKQIVEEEYKTAGIKPSDVSMGAVIITGETSRKRNAKAVVHALSDFAGDFVVAAAGPNMESVLAGKGSGAQQLSKEKNCVVANLDIGGGTTNICYFENGRVLDTACFNIGGRLIRIEESRICYVSEKVRPLLKKEGNLIKTGAVAEGEVRIQLDSITKELVSILEQSVTLGPKNDRFHAMITNQQITCGIEPDIITFSGGVADCMNVRQEDWFAFGDIGCLLGRELAKSEALISKHSESAGETMNATVIGAGNYSFEVSGSTIEYHNCTFPYKNIPVLFLEAERENLNGLEEQIKKQLAFYNSDTGGDSQIAFAFKGIACPSYVELERMAQSIANAARQEFRNDEALILVIESDIAKSLGQAIRRQMPRDYAILCIDHITCEPGDYIDIGVPAVSGKVVPVVVKTLLFQN